MFCEKCGYSLTDTIKFCPRCGTQIVKNTVSANTGVQAQNIDGFNQQLPMYGQSFPRTGFFRMPERDSGDTKSLWALIIAIATSPLLFIIRMLTQTEYINPTSWRRSYSLAVPDDIKAIMFVILAVLSVIVIILNVGNIKRNNTALITSYLIVPINIIVSIFIIMMESE